MKRYKVTSEQREELNACQEDLKWQLQAKARRLRRYTKRTDQYQQNKTLKEYAKKFYRELGKQNIQTKKPPDPQETKLFWQNIVEQEVEHNENAQWIKEQEQELKMLIQMEWKEWTVEELRFNVTRAENWKSPGPDKVPNLWTKQFTSLHQSIASAFSEVLKNPELTPEWLVEGSVILVPKKAET